MRDTWVFGYGSLVSPTSLAATIGRPVADDDIVITHLDSYGRRWNYGSMHLRGDWLHDGTSVERGLVVSLGLVSSGNERCNGVAVRVSEDELAMLDWRERDYERTDVTDAIREEPDTGQRLRGQRIVTYVPRSSAIDRYLAARDAGRAAIRASYWDLVDAAFSDLGGNHRALYATTPDPDVPVVDIALHPLP